MYAIRSYYDRFDLRIDHEFSERSRLISRYSFFDYDLYEPFSGVGAGPGSARPCPGFLTRPGHLLDEALHDRGAGQRDEHVV